MFLREKEEEVKESIRERAEKQSITRKSIRRKGRGGKGGLEGGEVVFNVSPKCVEFKLLSEIIIL